jgi:prolyl oligopeptidase
MRRYLLFAAAGLWCVTACSSAGRDQPPANDAPPVVGDVDVPAPETAPRGAHADTVHGVVLPDPWRWLEDTTSNETRRFVAAQDAYATAVLNRLVGLDTLRSMVERAYAATPTLDAVVPAGHRLFMTRWLGPRPSVFVLDSGATTERLLLSADSLAALGKTTGIRALSPSWDGRYAAIGTTQEGDERAAIAVLDVQNGVRLRDRVPDLLTSTSGTRYEVTWSPDGRGFFYPRLWPGSTEGPAVDKLARGRQYFHVLGTPQSADVPVFGYDVAPNVTADREDLPTRIYTAPGSSWLVASLYRVKGNRSDWYAAPLTSPLTTAPRWTRLDGDDARISLPQLRGDTLYALSRTTADRGMIVKRVLGTPGDSVWTTVVPEPQGVIMAFTVQQDGVYFTERSGGAVRLRRVKRGDTKAVELPVSSGGMVRLLRGAPQTTGVTFSTESWATPPHWQRIVNDRGEIAPLPIDDGSGGPGSSGLTITTLQAPSRDGVRVPVSVVYGAKALRNGVLDGTAPLLIEAYGGFAQATDPYFNPFIQVWTALGGVYAYAHVRGGGELGDLWHRDAMREHKQRTFDDMVGAIEALIAKRYTSAGRVTVMGISFGANIPGMVLAQRPELLAAALFEVGQPDEIRGARLDPTAARNIGELGDLETAAGIQLLRAASPYYQVPDSAHLPAIIVHSATGDYNFGNRMLAGKYVARLQAANRSTRPVLWVQTDGGHQALFGLSPEWAARAMSFSLWQSGVPAFQPPSR